ncbi:MAG: sigma-70 family RNA polymerase sigma factor [Acidobacteria bacterium]|nr:sigma-70 family RNA polymerase sigma factor [Acidobacteriota bacterium]
MTEPATVTAEQNPAEPMEFDPSAFADVVRRHQTMVFSIALRYLHDRPLAEELAQEVFLQLYENLAGIKSPAHLVHWLRRVTSHRCIDYSRRWGHRVEVSLEQAPEPVAAAPAGDIMLAARLRRLVATLPPRPRLVVVLRYEEGMELEEIARALDMPLGTVKSQLQRALALLREKAARYLGEVNL